MLVTACHPGPYAGGANKWMQERSAAMFSSENGNNYHAMFSQQVSIGMLRI